MEQIICCLLGMLVVWLPYQLSKKIILSPGVTRHSRGVIEHSSGVIQYSSGATFHDIKLESRSGRDILQRLYLSAICKPLFLCLLVAVICVNPWIEINKTLFFVYTVCWQIIALLINILCLRNISI